MKDFTFYLVVGMIIGTSIVLAFVVVSKVPEPARYIAMDSFEVRDCVNRSSGSTKEFRKCMHYER